MLVELAFDILSEKFYYYSVPLKLRESVKLYQRVYAALVGQKTVGLIMSISDQTSDEMLLKNLQEISGIIDKSPLIGAEQVSIAKFMKKHYLCELGQALFRMLPSGKKEKSVSEAEETSPIEKLPLPSMLPEQRNIVQKIRNTYTRPVLSTHLVFGITGSGKTRIYMELINEALENKRGVMLLLPEIALTYQFLNILKPYYGDRMTILHSNLSKSQRLSGYKRLQEGRSLLAVGTRSAVFSPVQNLSMIIIDEEHDSSFKEHGTPKYHAKTISWFRLRDVSSRTGSHTSLILGSATPSVESYYAALQKRVYIHRLLSRATGLPLPKIYLTSHNIFSKENHVFSSFLMRKMTEHLQKGNQVLLLLNRRGYSNYAFCEKCKNSIACPNCSVSLNYHQIEKSGSEHRPHLKCHLCGFQRDYTANCRKCNSPLILMGKGVQKVEDAIEYHFPDISYARLDQDTAKQKNYIQDVLSALKENKISILLGTQMIAKGFDLPKVTLVGIVNADIGLNLPDFRAFEKVSQLLIQAAGRAGRHLAGEVVMQTMHIESESMKMVVNYQYENFLKQELLLRKHSNFPPFCKLLKILLKSESKEELTAFCSSFKSFLQHSLEQQKLFEQNGKTMPESILGPVPAPIPKIKNEYRYQVLIKDPKQESLEEKATFLMKHIKKNRKYKNVRYEFDMDPLELI